MRKLISRSLVSTVAVILVLALFAIGSLAANGPAMDLGGMTVTIGHQYTGNHSEAYMQEGTEQYAHRKQVEEMFNCKIDVVVIPGGQYKDRLQTSVMAGEAPADVMFVQFHQIYEWGLKDFLMPLNEVLGEDFWNRYPEYAFADPDFYRIGSKIVGVPMPNYTWPRESIVMWDKTIFEQEGLPSPYDLVASGEWNWDTMRDIARKATKDTDGDGAIDQYGLVGGFRGHGTPWFATNNASALRTDASGRIVFTADEPAYIDTLNYFRGMVEEGIYRPEWSNVVGNAAMVVDYGVDQRKQILEKGHEFGIVPLPIGPNGDRVVGPRVFIYSWVVPKTVQNAREKLEVLAALFKTMSPYLDVEAANEQLWMDIAISYDVPDEESLMNLMLVNENMVIDQDIKFMKPLSSAVDNVMRGNKAAASAMQEIKDQCQALLDDLFDQ
jgi:ABC-type glycerol-3-phosphate transport system substrate-binding protein